MAPASSSDLAEAIWSAALAPLDATDWMYWSVASFCARAACADRSVMPLPRAIR